MRIYIIEMNCKEFQKLHGLQGLEKCPDCNGTGKKQELEFDPDKKDGSVICKVSYCPVCNGTGIVKKQKEV